MTNIKHELKKLRKLYKSLIEKNDKYLKLDVEGYITINKKNDNIYFYHNYYKDEKLIREYIKHQEINLIKNLTQKQYSKRIASKLIKRYNLLDKLINSFNDFDEYEKLPDYKKDLIDPVLPNYDKIVQEWYKTDYKKLDFNNENKHYLTNKGEKVRSKSEKILADLFSSKGILYKYEAPLQINNFTIYPDFTFISPYNMEEIYWEHFGMIANENYAASMIKKLSLYEKNGIKLGDNLIISMESANSGLDLEWIESNIDFYLIKKWG